MPGSARSYQTYCDQLLAETYFCPKSKAAEGGRTTPGDTGDFQRSSNTTDSSSFCRTVETTPLEATPTPRTVLELARTVEGNLGFCYKIPRWGRTWGVLRRAWKT